MAGGEYSDVVLPKYVAFIGHNGRFLGTQLRNGKAHMDFIETDVSDPLVACEIVPISDGSGIRVKSVQVGKFWQSIGNNLIVADNNNVKPDKFTRFKPARVGVNEIVLQSIDDDKFLVPSEDSGILSLYASGSSLTEEAKLKFVDLVKSREIYNIRFDEHAARVYNEQKVTLVSRKITNDKLDEVTAEISLQTEKPRVFVWNLSSSTRVGVKMKISVDSKISPVTKPEYAVTVESHEYESGVYKQTLEKLMMEKISLTAREKTMTTISVVGTRASVDVPFTYDQRDTLLKGETKVYNDMQDGMLTCSDIFDIHTVLHEETLSGIEVEV